jgi:hypothetical protein
MGEIIDQIKEKAKDVKDAMVDTTKDVADKTKETVDPSSSSNVQSYSSGSEVDRKYEEGGPGTNVHRNDDPLTEYKDKEPMTPSKINEHEPTAVKRNSSDQTITSNGQTGTNTYEAQEEYRKRGMTKVESHEHSHEGSSCSCGH